MTLNSLKTLLIYGTFIFPTLGVMCGFFVYQVSMKINVQQRQESQEDQELQDVKIEKMDEKLKNFSPESITVFSTKSQLIPPRERTKIKLDGKAYDADYSFHNDVWNSSKDSNCDVNLAVTLEGVEEEISFTITIASSNRNYHKKVAVSPQSPTAHIFQSLSMDANDTLAIFLEHNSSKNIIVSGEGRSTYLSIKSTPL